MPTQYLQPYSEASGFSLIETIVAIAILLVVVSGIMNLVYQGTTSSQLQQERITATYLAAEAIEFLRYDRDTYWLDAVGSNTFDDWLNDTDVEVCLESDGCMIDARFGEENISACSGECDVLKYNVDSKLYGYGSGLDWRESRYRRTVEVEAIDHDDGDNDDDEAVITVTVSWQRSGGETSSVVLRESITSWWR